MRENIEKGRWMMKKWIICMLTLILTLGSVPVYADGNEIFTDIKSSDWFYKDVLEMNATGVISGYEDNTFKAGNGVKKIEALAMVLRYMGLKEQVDQISDTEKALYIPKVGLTPSQVSDWARGYLVQGIKLGWIRQTAGVFDWNSEADRAWVAQLLIRAIGKESEAQKLEHTKTTFSDDNQITPSYRGYINAAVQLQLIKGYEEDNTFRPDRITSRAEMATLLKRMNPYLQKVMFVETGVIESITGTQVTVIKEDGTRGNYTIQSQAPVFEQKTKLTAGDLKAKDKVRMIVRDGVIRFVDRLEQNVSLFNTASGKIKDLLKDQKLIILETEGQTYLNLTYTQDTKILIDNQWMKGIEAYDLNGVQVDVTYNKENRVLELTPKNYALTKLVKGEITKIGEDYIIIVDSSGKSHTFAYSSTTMVQLEGERFPTVKNLRPGDIIEVDLGKNPVEQIKVVSLQETRQTEAILDYASNDAIYVKLNGELKGYYLSPNVVIKLNGIADPKLTDLEKGDQIRIDIEKDLVTKIEVLNRSYMEEAKGKLVLLDRTKKIINIKDQQGKLVAYTLSDQAKVYLDGAAVEWNRLSEGYSVILGLQKDEVTRITMDIVRSGEVLSYDASNKNLVLKEGNTEKTYKIAGLVSVEMFTNRFATLDQIKKGQQVKIYLNLNDQIEKIKIATSGSYEIVETFTGSKQLKLKDEAGTTWFVNYTESTSFIDSNNQNRTWSDLKKGDKVWLTFLGYDLIELKTEEKYVGLVTNVDLINKKVTLDVGGTFKEFTITDANGIVIGDYLKIHQVGNAVSFKKGIVQEGVISYVDPTGRIYIHDGKENNFQWITLDNSFLIKKTTSWKKLYDLQKSDKIYYYTIDGKVIAIEVK